MLHQISQVALVLLVGVFISTTLTSAYWWRSRSRSPAQCGRNPNIDEVCLEMLLQISQAAVALVVVVFVSTGLLNNTPFQASTPGKSMRPFLGRDEITECDTILRVSHVCYQCSERHPEEFNKIYLPCCTGEPSMRDYCDSIYLEPRKRRRGWYTRP